MAPVQWDSIQFYEPPKKPTPISRSNKHALYTCGISHLVKEREKETLYDNEYCTADGSSDAAVVPLVENLLFTTLTAYHQNSPERVSINTIGINSQDSVIEPDGVELDQNAAMLSDKPARDRKTSDDDFHESGDILESCSLGRTLISNQAAPQAISGDVAAPIDLTNLCDAPLLVTAEINDAARLLNNGQTNGILYKPEEPSSNQDTADGLRSDSGKSESYHNEQLASVCNDNDQVDEDTILCEDGKPSPKQALNQKTAVDGNNSDPVAAIKIKQVCPRKRARVAANKRGCTVEEGPTYSIDARSQKRTKTPSNNVPESEEIPIHGYFTIKEVESELVYCLTFAQGQLPSAHEGGPRQVVSQPAVSVTDDDQWRMRKVVDRKTIDGEIYYRVDWAPTWEPESELGGAENLIDEYLTTLKHGEVVRGLKGGEQKRPRGRPRKRQ